MASFACSRPEAILACALLVAASAHAVEARQGATTTEELRAEIGRVLEEGNTPGASIVVVRRDAEPWFAGLGVADVANRRPATAETLFRIGSVSKQFVSLAILHLADRGHLSLDDPVNTLVPDVPFENRWERTDPVRVVHLLEHTTGWDDIHLREYAKDGSRMSLREALVYGSTSRARSNRLANALLQWSRRAKVLDRGGPGAVNRFRLPRLLGNPGLENLGVLTCPGVNCSGNRRGARSSHLWHPGCSGRDGGQGATAAGTPAR